MGSLSIWHWLIVAIVAGILFFGWKQLPDMARSMGRSMRIFKTEIKGMSEDDKKREEAKADEAAATAAKEPPALEPRRAEIVKKDINGVADKTVPAARPRPAPGPRPDNAHTPGAQ